jgi:hypothetical protein
MDDDTRRASRRIARLHSQGNPAGDSYLGIKPQAPASAHFSDVALVVVADEAGVRYSCKDGGRL